MTSEELHRKIETVRKKLIQVGMLKGFTSPETIKISEKLDKLIYIKMSM
ncbi:aspartyl-phosphate phosphatase Spo0E family protein [Neobacillus cucumis]|nr:aspartyl-phosphate phosphatase Spo0E family protein [Neobacillus cucumis]